MPESSPYSTQNIVSVDLHAQATLAQLVNEALRNAQSLLALSRSPLANSALVTPALVKDDVTPTAEERGIALRLVLRWAVDRTAPEPSPYPFGAWRPLDDPTWRDPRWWRYNILRHRYLEPLHPDDFLGGGRFTDTLLGLTGISSADAFYDERNRALNEVAGWLRRQLLDGACSGELQQLAIQEALAPLAKQPNANLLLAIAATFDEVFPRTLLLDLAQRERMVRAEAVLEEVLAMRLLLTGDRGASLWLAPALRTYLYARQPAADVQHRHRLIAAHAEAEGRLLAAVRHHQRGGQDGHAVRLLLGAVDALVQEIEPPALIELIQAFNLRRLEAGERYAVHLLLGDLLHRLGQPEAALTACRQALQSARTPEDQARVYRRMGKLYESRNQQHALRYYQQAIERFNPAAPELAEALKDRGWLHLLRQEWQAAEVDFLRALEGVTTDGRARQGAIYDAMSNLYRKTGDRDRALHYAELGLTLREEDGDLLGIAKSQGNLGLLYRSIGDYAHAVAAYTEAMSTYARIGNQELVAVALLNIGAAFYLDGKVDEAVRRYHASLAISRALGLPLLEIKAHYNLAEAYPVLGQMDAASEHWQLGYHLCRQHTFDDQEQDFVALRTTLALPHPDLVQPAHLAEPTLALSPGALDPEEAAVLDLAQRERKLTAQRLMEITHVSRATATRRLAALVEKGYLHMAGKGRGVHYRPARAPTGAPSGDVGVVLAAEELDVRLRQVAAALHDHFGVAAIGIVVSPALAPPPALIRLAVRFDVNPSLERFFALEQHLCERLQRVVDLMPESAAGAQVVVRWL